MSFEDLANLGRSGGGRLPYSTAEMTRLGNMLEVRRAQRAGGTAADMWRRLLEHRARGFGLGPERRPMSFERFKRYARALGQRGSAGRRELAQFIRAIRNVNPAQAARIRHLIAAGRASSTVAFVGGRVGGAGATAFGSWLRGAFTAGRLFAFTPAGILISLALLLVVAGLALYLGREDPAEAQVAAINCDCPNVNAGILNIGYIPHCRDVEGGLVAAAQAGEFKLDVENGKIVGGSVCDSTAAGADAWPVVGAPARPPRGAARDTESCRRFEGLVGRCADPPR